MDFNRELPHFLAEIKRLFSLTELGSYFGGLERSNGSRATCSCTNGVTGKKVPSATMMMIAGTILIPF